MATPSLLLSRRDLEFQLYTWLDTEALTRRARYAEHSRETFDGALELSERIATHHFAPHNKKNDQEEPRFDGERVHTLPEAAEALETFAKSGLLAAAMDEEFGGMRLPQTVATACFGFFQAANVGTAAYPFLTLGNARLLCAHGSPEQIDTYVRPMLEGRYFGTMCLSEPQAGSSLADVATRAEERPDGTYRLFGSKMWISGGDHELSENIVHLVLARIPGGPPGVKGLSLFIVPKRLVGADGTPGERNDVVPAGLNHKMGYRGTTNALLSFGEGARHRPGGEAGAVGYLVGEEHRGLAYMFHMMNEARIGIGAGAMALGYTGYLKSLAYARERPQGRPLTARGKDAASPQVPIVEHTDVRRMLLAQKTYVEGALGLLLYCSRLVDEQGSAGTDEERARAGLLLDVLTPIAKSWPSQWCLEANSLAIQVHGGYGYTREYDVEQHYRDNRLNPIHEGTHGIQGLDLLGRKAVLDGGAGLLALGEAVLATVERATRAGGEGALLGGELRARWERVTAVTARLWETGDPVVALANSSAYLEAVGHVVVAWIWLGQFLATGELDDDFHLGKRQAARFFFRHELPRTDAQFALLEARDTTVLETEPGWL